MPSTDCPHQAEIIRVHENLSNFWENCRNRFLQLGNRMDDFQIDPGAQRLLEFETICRIVRRRQDDQLAIAYMTIRS